MKLRPPALHNQRINTFVRAVSLSAATLMAPGVDAQIVNPDAVPIDPPTAGQSRNIKVDLNAAQTVQPRARPAPGTYTGRVDVSPYHPDPNARIFYTLDGSTPTLESPEYLPRMRGSLAFYAPLTMTSSQTLKMLAYREGQAPSDIVSFDYILAVAPPASIHTGGTYQTLPTAVVLSSATPDAAIHYTLDGSTPNRNSPVYNEPLDLSRLQAPVMLSAVGVKDGAPDSPVVRMEYRVDPSLPVLTDTDSIPDVIAAMTLQEKARLLTGKGTELGAAGASNAIPRLHITSLELADGPAGVRLGGRFATAFPNPMLLASTWNNELLTEVGHAIGRETAYYGADLILGPGMNIHRDPVGGRVFEYYSEDPMLSGTLAGAWTNGAQNAGVGATLKHYVANQYENNRRTMNVRVSERALREIYLKGFEIAIRDADPSAVMVAYNLVNGIHSSESAYLLKDMLRDTFGFNGLTMPDWGAYHNAQSSYSAGLDLNTPGGFLFGGLLGGPDITLNDIADYKISESDIERALTNILGVVLKSENFKRQVYDRSTFKALTTLSDELKRAGDELSQRAAREGVILLKNADNTLPLPEGTTGAVVGKHAVDTFLEPENIWGSPSKGIIFQGGGSARVNVDPDDVVSLVQGLGNSGFDVYQTDALVEGMTAADASAAASNSDVGIILIGRPGQENTDNTSIDLTDEEIQMIEHMSTAYHAAGKKIVVLLNVAHPIVTSPWEQRVDAILYIGLPGNYGANVVADVLVGRVNPSGKTTDTWPLAHQDVPVYGQAPAVTDVQIDYSDDIYVGYRHYDQHPGTVAYPFGFGLSYTRFSYSNFELEREVIGDQPLRLSVDITNTGETAGQEIAQLYVTAPSSTIKRPVKELKGYAKTRLLAPGESQRLRFTLNRNDLAYFDENAHDWAVEDGRHTFIIGGSSDAAMLEREGVRAEIRP